jgi:hypothetical protein
MEVNKCLSGCGLGIASGFVSMACAAVKIIEKIDLKWCEGEVCSKYVR